MKIILLMGITASGKTTIGRLLAQKKHCDFIDMDEAIEKCIGKPLRQFYERCGKEAFQEYEHNLLKKIFELNKGNCNNKRIIIISTGGGLIENAKSVQFLNEHIENQSFSLNIFFLSVQWKILFNRLIERAKKQKSIPAFLKVNKCDFKNENISVSLNKSSKNLNLKSFKNKFFKIYKRRMKLMQTLDCCKIKTKRLSIKQILRKIAKNID